MNQIGNYASLIGLLVSFFGFIITVFNVVKSRRAADDAAKASARVLDSIQSIDLISDISSALRLIDEIRHMLRGEELKLLIERCQQLRTILIRIKGTDSYLQDEQRSTLQGAITHLRDLETKAETALENDSALPKSVRSKQVITKHYDHLQEILTQIRTQKQRKETKPENKGA